MLISLYQSEIDCYMPTFRRFRLSVTLLIAQILLYCYTLMLVLYVSLRLILEIA